VRWCRSAVKCTRLSRFATSRTRCRLGDADTRLCVRTAAAHNAFLLVDGLPSTTSTARAAFGCFLSTMPPSDFPPLFPPGSSPVAFPDRSSRSALDWGGISQVPCIERRCVLGVSDRAGSSDDSRLTPSPVSPSVPIKTSASRNVRYATQYPAHIFPCQRFTSALACRRA